MHEFPTEIFFMSIPVTFILLLWLRLRFAPFLRRELPPRYADYIPPADGLSVRFFVFVFVLTAALLSAFVLYLERAA